MPGSTILPWALTWMKNLYLYCLFHLKNISKLQHMVFSGEREKNIHPSVPLCLDYCNAMFTFLDKSSLSPLQAIQNTVAILLKGSSKLTSLPFYPLYIGSQEILKFLYLHTEH